MIRVLGVGPYGYARSHRWVEGAGISALVGLLVRLAVHVANTAGPDALPYLLGTGLLAYVLADFLSGLVHWAADTLGDERTPVIGPHLIRPFREHHVDPEGITRHDWVETNGNNCLFALPWLALAVVLVPDTPGLLYFACVLVGMTMVGMMATNQIHKWAHTPRPPAIVRGLQRAGIILGREHHAHHHRAPHDRCYCITTGWLDGLLDGVGFFRALERLISPDRMLSGGGE